MNKFQRAGVTGIFLTMVSTTALAEKITGLYSSFHQSQQSGDIVGMEIHIVPNPTGYSAIVQASEGAPGTPEVFSLKVSGKIIEFTVLKESKTGLQPGAYRAEVTNANLKITGPNKFYEIPRKESFWQ